MTNSTTSSKALDGFRRRIDEIDTVVHDCLIERTGIVQQVAAEKHKAGMNTVIMRPGREAAILRRLVGRHEGQMPAATVAHIWREIISAMLRIEGDLEVYVGCDGSATRQQTLDLWDLARFHWGADTPIYLADSAASAFVTTTEKRDNIAVMPLPAQEDSAGWWQQMGSADFESGDPWQCQVIARLPFIQQKDAPLNAQALVIANVDREDTGDDRTLVVVKKNAGLSDALAGLDGYIMAQDDKTGKMLLDIAGYVADDDERLKQLCDVQDADGAARVIGGYACPITLENDGDLS